MTGFDIVGGEGGTGDVGGGFEALWWMGWLVLGVST